MAAVTSQLGRLVVATACALVAYVAVTAVSSTAAPARVTSASCYPYANVPYPTVDYQAVGSGAISCDAGAPVYWFTVRLVNRSGNILAQAQNGPLAATWYRTVATVFVSCRGAIIHSFLYINVSGVGKSDTSGSNSDCAY
jgi:hypothetical protein